MTHDATFNVVEGKVVWHVLTHLNSCFLTGPFLKKRKNTQLVSLLRINCPENFPLLENRLLQSTGIGDSFQKCYLLKDHDGKLRTVDPPPLGSLELLL